MDNLNLEEDVLNDNDDLIINFPPEVQKAIEEVFICCIASEKCTLPACILGIT